MSLHGCHEHFPAELPLQRPQAAAARQHAVPRGGRNGRTRDLRAGGPPRPGTISSGLTRTCMAARGFVFFCCCLSLGFGVFSDRGGGTEEEEGTARVLGAWQCA